MAAKKITDHEMYQRSLPSPDDTLQYRSDWLTARLLLHRTGDEQFVKALLAATGGSCNPEYGGNWERARCASEFLALRELGAKHADQDAAIEHWRSLDAPLRGMVETYVSTSGITRPVNSMLLTQGECIVWRWWTRFVEQLSDEELAEIVDSFGPVEVLSPTSPAESVHDSASFSGADQEGGGDHPPIASPRLPLPSELTTVIEEGVTIPDDYLEALPDLASMKVDEVKQWCRSQSHRALIAEISRGSKQRKGLVDWLKKRTQGFEIPEEWRS